MSKDNDKDVDDYVPKGIEKIKCPINRRAVALMVAKRIYSNPIVAWREAISNACDASRHKTDKIIKVYTNVGGDGIIEDWGTGIVDFERFIGIGRVTERNETSADLEAEDDKEIGYYGVGKNSFIGLSKIKLVQFYSHSSIGGMDRGLITSLIMENDDIDYTKPEYYDSMQVLSHPGLKVVIRHLNKIYSTNKLIDYVSKRFALKIARGYKIYVDDILVPKPDSFDITNQKVLFRLDSGAKVYGNLSPVEKPISKNIDVLVRQIFIEGIDVDYKVEGWINCDQLDLAISRDSLSTDEDSAYPEFMAKLESYLAENFDRKDQEDKLNDVKDKKLEEYTSRAIVKYYQRYKEHTLVFLEGPVSRTELKGTSLKGGDIWPKIKERELVKNDNPELGGEKIIKRVKRRKKKGKKKGKKGVEGRDPPKIIPKVLAELGAPPNENKYDMIEGERDFKLEQESDENEMDEEEILPKVKYAVLPRGKDNPLVFFDKTEEAFIINYSHESRDIFIYKKHGRFHEVIRGIIRSVPENQGLTADEFDKKYYELLDTMLPEME